MWRLLYHQATAAAVPSQQHTTLVAALQRVLHQQQPAAAATQVSLRSNHTGWPQQPCSHQKPHPCFSSSSSSSSHCWQRHYSSTGADLPTQPAEDSPAVSSSTDASGTQQALATASNKQPAVAAGRDRQQVQVEPASGFATLPPRATASGYPESFTAAAAAAAEAGGQQGQEQPPAGASVVPIQEVQEQLRIQLRQEVQEQHEEGGEVDAYSLSRSLTSADMGRSFDSPASLAAATDAAAAGTTATATGDSKQQPQPLSASDRELLSKLVGILTKEGKKSRARRIVLEAMHIIKQQVAQGPQGPGQQQQGSA